MLSLVSVFSDALIFSSTFWQNGNKFTRKRSLNRIDNENKIRSKDQPWQLLVSLRERERNQQIKYSGNRYVFVLSKFTFEFIYFFFDHIFYVWFVPIARCNNCGKIDSSPVVGYHCHINEIVTPIAVKAGATHIRKTAK